MNRRSVLRGFAAFGTAMMAEPLLSLSMQSLLQRQIPVSGEMLPAVGVGTWQTFDVGASAGERLPLKEVLKIMTDRGAKVIDSSPMYGQSEAVVGDLSTEENVNHKLFMATKVWTSGLENGIRQMNESFSLLKRTKIDLMQIHNLVDWQTHLKTLRAWKEEGRIRYIGLTHYLDSTHEKIEEIFKAHPIDFIQVNYSILDRHAEKRLLPAAADHQVAVLVNRPFQEGALFDKVKGKGIPEWCAAFDCKSWAQFFLKFILSNTHVTCVIPGTSKVRHLIDNLGAAAGKLPDQAQRLQMIRELE
jgi:diketogulonate reductase-like aldo/keto reductase